MTDPIAILIIILFLAFLVESLVEYLFGQIFEHIPTLAKHKWLLMYLAAAVGVLGAWVYDFDLIMLLSIYIGKALPVTWYGIILTGLAIGRGSNFIHDLVTKFFVKTDTPVNITRIDQSGMVLVPAEQVKSYGGN